MGLIQELEQFKGKLALRPIHGRKDPDEKMDGWGFTGVPLFFDWIHITYCCHINIGYGAGFTEPMSPGPNSVYFHGDMLAIDRDGDISYYGDWEIVPAEDAEPMRGKMIPADGN